MSLGSAKAISQAAKYLQQGDAEGARALLAKFVREHPESEEGWLLLSQTIDDIRQKTDCLRQVLKINPANDLARQQIEGLQAGKTASQSLPSPPKPGAMPSKVYVAKSSPEPGLDFWEEDEIEGPPAPTKPAAIMGEKKPSAIASSIPAQPPPLSVQAIPGPAPTSPVIPSFAPDTAEAAPEAVPLKPPETQPPNSQRPTSREEPLAKDIRQKRKAKHSILPAVIIGVVLLLVAAAVVSGILVINYFSAALTQPTAPFIGQQAPSATPTPTEEPTFALPPSWTPTETEIPTPTPTITPTPQPSAKPTLIPPQPTALAWMDRIQKEVSNLRGLPVLAQTPTYIVPPLIAKQILMEEYMGEAAIAQLADESRRLSALGLIMPTYDLVNYTLNSIVDNVGGYYRHDTMTIYILGMNFGVMERHIYSYEYNHALIDQHFDMAGLTNPENCEAVVFTANDDRCEAINALIEGDATLTMNQWLAQYALPEDKRILRKYRVPDLAFPEQSPPDYVIHLLNFPYLHGIAFVENLFDEGNWTRVNQAYGQLPLSTEQIIHPEKYRQFETPIPVQDTPLQVVLGEQWRLIKNNTLGEWNTFLILAYGADKFAQQAVKDSEAAAAGWGGDQYQVYYNENSDQTVLAAHWVWDTEQDTLEFKASMLAYLTARFRGNAITRPSGLCWEVNLQTTCFYSQDNQSLWLLAPDQTTLDLALSLYPLFSKP